ncbi:MAG: protein kinase [Planctomycetes bacterium]|nr:protein kinase [Planctomycetota bacterium]
MTREDDDTFLDDAFEAALEAASQGLPFDLEAWTRRRPELAEELQRIVAMVSGVAERKAIRKRRIQGYELVREIGHGAMGTVFLARQPELDREVAVKLYPQGAWLGQDTRKRFLREVRALARLRHPNVVTIHDVVNGDDVLGFAMECVEGASLEELRKRLDPAREPTIDDVRAVLGDSFRGHVPYHVFVCHTVLAVARGLAATHDAGLLHRDVKPSNILLRTDGTALLTDFGLVFDPNSESITHEPRFVGTLAYAPPEQLRGEIDALTAASDIYALGATAYELLTLRRPHAGTSTRQMLDQIERRALVPLRQLRPDLPRDLDTIVSHCLEPEAGDRYATAHELTEDLERLLSLRPLAIRPPNTWLRFRRFVLRHWLAALVSLLVLTALAATAVVAYLRGLESANTQRRVEELVRQARLQLIEPTHSERYLLARYWDQGPNPDFPVQFEKIATKAIRAYDEALSLSHDEMILGEREAVATAYAILHGETRAPSAILTRRAPLTGRVLTAWKPGRPVTVTRTQIASASPDDRMLLGLFAYLVPDVNLCELAWESLDLDRETERPIVDAAVGQIHLLFDRPEMAYPRIVRAQRAFPEAAFLRVAMARCAVAEDDFDRAERDLRAAEDLEDYKKAPYGAIIRTQADIDRARGNWKAAEAGYRKMLCYHVGVPTRRRYAELLEVQGRIDEAIQMWATAHDLHPVLHVHRNELLRLVDVWWRGLPFGEKLVHVTHDMTADERHGPSLKRYVQLLEQRFPSQTEHWTLADHVQPKPFPEHALHSHPITRRLFGISNHRRLGVLSFRARRALAHLVLALDVASRSDRSGLLRGLGYGLVDLLALSLQPTIRRDPEAPLHVELDFDEDGDLPSSHPEVRFFSHRATDPERLLFDVRDGFLIQHTKEPMNQWAMYIVGDKPIRLPPVPDRIDPSRSLIVEARLRIANLGPGTGAHLQVSYGRQHLGFYLNAGPGFPVVVPIGDTGTAVHPLPFGTLEDAHTYRIECPANSDRWVLSVDGAVVCRGTSIPYPNNLDYGFHVRFGQEWLTVVEVHWEFVRVSQR